VMGHVGLDRLLELRVSAAPRESLLLLPATTKSLHLRMSCD
jgi:hypothetical protein